MNEQAAYMMLDGKQVGGYVISVSEITKQEDSDEIKGTMNDLSDRNRPPIPFVILANESDLDTPYKIEQLVFEMEDEIDEGRSLVRITYA